MIVLIALALVAPSVADAERALAVQVQRDGQWTSFRAAQAPGAVMFVPGMVDAQAWLKDRPDPPQPVDRRPERTITSCDGSLALSTGRAIRSGGGLGKFTTIWRRDTTGGWRWVLDQGSATKSAAPLRRAVRAAIASCRNPEGAIGGMPVRTSAAATPTLPADASPEVAGAFVFLRQLSALPAIAHGNSRDGTLSWHLRGDSASGVRTLIVWRWTGSGHNLDLIETTP